MNTAVEAYKLPAEPARSRGVWATAWRRLKNDRVGMVSLAVVAVFVLMIMLSSVGLVARDWQREVGVAGGHRPAAGSGRQGCKAGRPHGHRSTRAQVRRVEGAGRQDPGQRAAACRNPRVRRRP